MILPEAVTRTVSDEPRSDPISPRDEGEANNGQNSHSSHEQRLSQEKIQE
jgi:hypothetical protein